MNDSWSKAIRSRFIDREELSHEVLYETFYQRFGLLMSDVYESFQELENNYGVPAGILRPDDKLSKLTEAPSTTNPFRWFSWRSKSEFREAELMEELGLRLQKSGSFDESPVVETIQDFVFAWCGKPMIRK